MNSNQNPWLCLRVDLNVDKRRNKVTVQCPQCGTLRSGTIKDEPALSTIHYEHFSAAHEETKKDQTPGRKLKSFRLPV